MTKRFFQAASYRAERRSNGLCHAWSSDPVGQAAIRAAEDGREGPLPTLEEAISGVTERRPPEPRGGGNVTGLRTDLVTLEVTHDGTWGHPSSWPWFNSSFLAWVRSRRGELVRVVEEAHFDDLAQVAMERDAAIRERDKLRAERMTQALGSSQGS